MNKLVILIAIGSVFQICSGGYVPTFTGDTLRKVMKREGCSQFHKAAKKVGLDITFITRSATIFCPNDNAFRNLPTSMRRVLSNNLNTLYFVILYHMYIDNKLTSADLKDGLMLSTIVDQRSFLNVRKSKNEVDMWINGAKLVKKDLVATNGIIHVIDRVILPPRYSLTELMNRYSGLSIMRNILAQGKLLLPVGYTCFALLNRAFDYVPKKKMRRILGSRYTLARMARLYIIPRIIFGGAMRERPWEVTTLSGRIIRIIPEKDGIYLELQGVSYPSKALRPKLARIDIMTRNGVVHTVDNLLIPQALPATEPPIQEEGRKPPPGKVDAKPTVKPKKADTPAPPTQPPTPAPAPDTPAPPTPAPQTPAPQTSEAPTVAPATPEPATPEPATPEPATPEPATPEPPTLAPDTDAPATPEPEVPTFAPPTFAPDTDAPATPEPEVPTFVPPTFAPDTDAPATPEPEVPTFAPPTFAPEPDSNNGDDAVKPKTPESEIVKPEPTTGDTDKLNIIPTISSNNGGPADPKPDTSDNKINGDNKLDKQLSETSDSGGNTNKAPERVPTTSPKLPTVAEQLSNHGSKLFLDIIKQYNSDLFDIISSEGEKHTVFAPTDAAITNLPPSFQKKFRTSPDFIKNVILYHFSKSVINIKNIRRYKEIPSLTNDILVFRKFGKKSMIGKAYITSNSIEASNGIVFTIDRLIVPSTKDLDYMVNKLGLLSFMVAIQKAGLEEKLTGSKGVPLIVWAPTDAAFDKLHPENLAYILNNDEVLQRVVKYHITPGFFYTGLMGNSWVYVFKSLNKDKIRARKYGSKVAKDLSIWNPNGPNAFGVKLDVITTNGIINVIDEVLIPEGIVLPSKTSSQSLGVENGEKIVDKFRKKFF